MTSFLLVTDYAGQGVNITNPLVLAPLITFLVSLVALVYIEIRISTNPILAPAILKQKGVTPLYLVQALLMSAQFSVRTFSLQSFFHLYFLASLPFKPSLKLYILIPGTRHSTNLLHPNWQHLKHSRVSSSRPSTSRQRIWLLRCRQIHRTHKEIPPTSLPHLSSLTHSIFNHAHPVVAPTPSMGQGCYHSTHPRQPLGMSHSRSSCLQ